MTDVAILPARGGSKRIPRKNIRNFHGRPMIEWPILEAIRSRLFAAVIVSTDDDEIADTSRSAGAEVPFMRPHQLADDHTSTAAVMAHATAWMADNNRRADGVCCIYPASPFLRAADLAGARQLLGSSNADYVLAVAEYPHPVQRALVPSADGTVYPLYPEDVSTRTQDLPVAFHDAGQFCWGRFEAFRQASPVLGGRTLPWQLSRLRAVDVDTPEDWQYAEHLHTMENGPSS